MFEYIKGALIEAAPTKVVVDVQGLGYAILIPLNQYAQLPAIGSIVALYLSYVVREDSQKLYGFLTKDSRELFEHVIDISGIGPKTALAIVGHLDIGELQVAISQGNIPLISKIPGIGKKTAERLIVEMRDKVKKLGKGISLPGSASSEFSGDKPVVSDALSALLNLGYSNLQAQKAIQDALSQTEAEPSLAQLITLALQSMCTPRA